MQSYTGIKDRFTPFTDFCEDPPGVITRITEYAETFTPITAPGRMARSGYDKKRYLCSEQIPALWMHMNPLF